MDTQPQGVGNTYPHGGGGTSPANQAEHARVMDRIRLRDEFAMAALTGALTKMEIIHGACELAKAQGQEMSPTQMLSKFAYECADAMLKARDPR